jgi:hypothetical protein
MKLFTQGRYATIASTAALVVALGGTSYAAAQITSGDIKDGTIQNRDVSPAARVVAKNIHNDNGTVMDGSTKTVLAMNLHRGKYVVNSKATALGSANGSYVGCFLVAPNGTTVDNAWWWAGSGETGYGTVSDQAVLSVGSTGTLQLRCSGGNSTVYYKELTAVRVASIANLTGSDVAKAPAPKALAPQR